MMVNFSRKLGLVENLFATLHTMGAMLYVNVASIQGSISLDMLRSAIDLLQKRHPLLQVCLQELEDGFFFVDSTGLIPLRAIERQHEQQWLKIAEDELQQKFSGEFEPLCRITLLQSSTQPYNNELIVTFHHAIADGISALHFIHELLSYYQQFVEGIPIPEVDTLPLLPPLEQLLQQSLAETNAADLTQVSHTTAPPTLLIEQTASVVDRQTRLLSHEFNPDLTLKLKSRCRDEQTTVHGALCAAMAIAFVQQLPPQPPVVISCGSSINLRASCFPPVEPTYLGFFSSNITTTHHADPNTHFWDLARECQSSVLHSIQHKIPHNQVSNAELLSQYNSAFLAQFAEYNMGRNTTTHVSNLGQCDLQAVYGSIRLKSFYFTVGLNLVGTCFWLGVVTLNQKLCCTFTYTDPLISRKTAEALANSVVTVLTIAVD